MKRGIVLLAGVMPLFGVYSYYSLDNFNIVQSAKRGSERSRVGYASGPDGDYNEWRVLISKIPVPGGSGTHEVKISYRLTASGGRYVTYLKASANAYLGPTSTGTFYALELQNPTFTGGNCAATLALYKRVSNVLTQITSTPDCLQRWTYDSGCDSDDWQDHGNLGHGLSAGHRCGDCGGTAWSGSAPDACREYDFAV